VSSGSELAGIRAEVSVDRLTRSGWGRHVRVANILDSRGHLAQS
jgi:hypothetical protein